MALEGWNTLFQIGSAVLLGLTFAFGVGAILTGMAISNRQAALIATTGERVAVADAKAAVAGEHAAKAGADAAAANERAGRLELEAAQQRERAANAEKELFELRQRVAPRRLSADQRTLIASSLRDQSTNRMLQVVRLGDAEAGAFADDIIAALKMAGWTVGVTGVGTMSPPRYELVYLLGQSATIPPEVEALRRALEGAGVVMSTQPGAGPGGGSALIVGLKPLRP